MKIYRLHMQGGNFNGFDSNGVWFTRISDASKIAQELKDYNLEASQMSPEPDLEEFNVPSKKSDLVHFLNRNCYR